MRIIYKDTDGVKVIIPSVRWLYTNNMNHDEAMQYLIDKRVPRDIPSEVSEKYYPERVPEEVAKKYPHFEYKIVDDNKIPSDRYFRNAWDIKSGKITTDIAKAKEIKKDYLRQERKPLLESLDIEIMRNIKDPVKLDEIESKKQKLRDITKQVDNLKTIEELKLFKIEV